MHIGKLDRPILIETKTEVLDTDYGTGTGSFTYGEFFTGFASVRDVLAGSKEATNEEIRLTKRPVKIVMRYVEGITAGMRVTLQEPRAGNRDAACRIGPQGRSGIYL
jgi:head-tail adaptor